MRKVKISTKEINLYARYIYDPEAEAKRKLFIRAVIPLAATLVIILGVFAYLTISTLVANNKVEDIDNYLSSPEISDQYKECLQLQDKQNELVGISGILNNIDSGNGAYAAMTQGLMESIRGAMSGYTITDYKYDAEMKTLTITAETKSVRNMASMVKRLKSTGLIGKVTYTGYTSSEKTYVTTITCIVGNE
ncbi:MAG: hypothetical protein RSD88_01615 [Anaerovoracaceae bacterium]